MKRPAPPVAALIPHTGTMCLLDAVVAWDPDSATCEASSHVLANNPLREGQHLPATAAIEYAAQAMAVHGGLLAAASERPTLGYLVSLRDVVLSRATFDHLGPVLKVSVERLAGDAASLMYRFKVGDNEHVLAEGSATVVVQRRESA